MINSVQFNWNIEEFDALVRSCEKDDGVRLALKYLSKDARILEAGCGVGRVVRYLQDWGYDIEGLELNASIVKQVIDRFPDMRIRQGNILHIPVSDEYYGGLLSYDVVEHFTQGPDEALREMFRVLQPGGVAVVTVPAFNALRFLKYWRNIQNRLLLLKLHCNFLQNHKDVPDFELLIRNHHQNSRASL